MVARPVPEQRDVVRGVDDSRARHLAAKVDGLRPRAAAELPHRGAEAAAGVGDGPVLDRDDLDDVVAVVHRVDSAVVQDKITLVRFGGARRPTARASRKLASVRLARGAEADHGGRAGRGARR